MTDKDSETLRELVRLERLLMGLPDAPRQGVAVAGQDRGAGPEVRIAKVIPFRARGT